MLHEGCYYTAHIHCTKCGWDNTDHHCVAHYGTLIPDDRLQDIADAPRCEHGKIDGHLTNDPYHPYVHGLVKNWCPGTPKLRSLLDALNEEGNDE